MTTKELLVFAWWQIILFVLAGSLFAWGWWVRL